MSRRVLHSASFLLWCLLAGAFIFAFNIAGAQTYYSRNNSSGLSAYRTSWPGGFPPVSGDNIFSSGTITIQGYLLHGYSGNNANATYTGAGTSLIVEDTLRISGNLYMYNGSSIHIKPNGILIVHGNYFQDANVNFKNEGNSIYLGNWETADSPLNTSGTGNFYVAGAFKATGSSMVSKAYSQLRTDSPALYTFSRNTAVASVCAGSNSGRISFSDPHLKIIRWESSTDFFRSQVTTIVNEETSQLYANLTKTTSYRVYYEKNDGGLAWSDASAIIVNDIMQGSSHAVAKLEMPGTDLFASYSLDGHVTDGSGKSNNGTIIGGAVPVKDRFNLPGKAYSFDGVDDYIATTTQYPIPGPQVFSISIWFKTTSTTGGRLIGYGNLRTGSSKDRDRHLYMNNSGQLFFGVYPDGVQRVVKTAESYNDGRWHHAVASLSPSGMALYVDGKLKGSIAEVTGAENFSGYWRIGYDFLNTWPEEPASRFFKGSLDDIYIFNKGLSSAGVEKLFRAGAAPVCEGEPVKLSAATIEGATYKWTGPDGFSSAEQNPVIPAISMAKAGEYSVTVSFDGCSSRGTAEVQVNPLVQGGSVTAASSSVCSGKNSATLTLSGHTGSIVRWESSTDNFKSSIVPVEYTTAELSVYDLSVSTSFRAVVSSGNCGIAISGAATIEVDKPAIGGSLSGDAPGCFGDNGGILRLSGYEGTILRWESSHDDFRTVTSIAHAAPEFNYTNLTKTTSYRVVAGNGGSCAPVYSTPAKITVKAPLIEGTEAVNSGGTDAGGSLYAVYPLNGNAADVSGMENHGSVVGAIPAADRFGAAGQAYSFDGVDDKIFTTSLYPSPGPQVFTISLWFKTTETDGGRLIGYSNSQTDWSSSFDRHLYMDSLGHLYFGVFGDWKYGTVHAAQKYNDGEWHHAVASLSPAGLKLYVDGLLMDSNTGATSAEYFSGYWRLGGDSMGGDWPGRPSEPYFKGVLDDVVIYNRELDITEVKNLSSAGLLQVCEGETLALSGPSRAGATYAWTGPDGFTSADQNPLIPDFSSANAGTYLLIISLDGCQAQISTEVAALPALSGGTLASVQNRVCYGSNEGTISLSGHAGNIVRWESSTDNFEFDITPIAHTETDYTFTNLLQSTGFRAVVGNGGKVCPDKYSSELNITVDPETEGGEASASISRVCEGSNSGTISLSGHTGEIIRWESSADKFEEDIVVIDNATAELPFGELRATTSYRAVVKSGLCGEKFSAAAVVYVDEASAGGTLAGGAVVCAGSNSGTLRLSGHRGEIVSWEYSPDPDFTTITSLSPSAVPEELEFTNLDATTYFRAMVKNGECSPAYSGVAEIKVLSLSGGSLSGGQAVCPDNNSGTIQLSNYTGNILRWESSADDFLTDVTPLAHTDPAFDYTNLSATTSYRVIVGNDGVCPEESSSVVKVEVMPALAGGTLASAQSQVCYGVNEGTISLGGHAGNVVGWESSTDNFEHDIRPIAHTGTEYTFSGLLQSTSFRAVTGNGNICANEYSSVLTISVEPAVTGGVLTASAGQVCEGNNNGSLVLRGNVGAVIRWESSKDNFQSDVTSISHTLEELSFTGLAETLSYRAVVGIPSCGEAYSSVAVIEVQPAPVAGVLKGGKRILPGNNSGVLHLEGYKGEIVQWETSDDNFVADIRIPEGTGDQFSYRDLQSSTWYRVLVRGASSCAPVYSQTAQLIINNSPQAVTDTFTVASKAFTSERSLLENDSDPDADPVYIVPAEGVLTEAGNTVTIKADGYFYFESAEGFSGPDSFSYQLCDDAGDASVCTAGVVFLQIESGKNIIIYQGFSPGNGDQKNDVWVIKHIEHYPNNHVQVYNRYGTLVYEVKGYNNSDKVFSGYSNRGAGMGAKQLPQDTYFYQIRLDEKTPGLTGFVIINR